MRRCDSSSLSFGPGWWWWFWQCLYYHRLSQSPHCSNTFTSREHYPVHYLVTSFSYTTAIRKEVWRPYYPHITGHSSKGWKTQYQALFGWSLTWFIIKWCSIDTRISLISLPCCQCLVGFTCSHCIKSSWSSYSFPGLLLFGLVLSLII